MRLLPAGAGDNTPAPAKIDYKGIMRVTENWTASPETIARIVHAFDVVLDAYRDLKFCQDGVTVALTELETTLDTIEREIEQQKSK